MNSFRPFRLFVTAALAIGLAACGSAPSNSSGTKAGFTPPTQQQVQTGIVDAVQIAQIALNTYSAIATAKQSGAKLTPAQITTLASNDLNGVAAIAQANIGQIPQSANIAAGAANPAAGQAIASALPAAPITQSTVNALYSAAAQATAP